MSVDLGEVETFAEDEIEGESVGMDWESIGGGVITEDDDADELGRASVDDGEAVLTEVDDEEGETGGGGGWDGAVGEEADV